MNIVLTKEIILKDIKENNIALKYLLKYRPELVTGELLEEIIDNSKYAIQYIPRERLTRNMIMKVVLFKDPRCLFNYVPKELIDEDMEEIIITTYSYTGIKWYLKTFEDSLTENKIKKIIINQEKRYREFLKNHIPKKFLTDEILKLIPKE